MCSGWWVSADPLFSCIFRYSESYQRSLSQISWIRPPNVSPTRTGWMSTSGRFSFLAHEDARTQYVDQGLSIPLAPYLSATVVQAVLHLCDSGMHDGHHDGIWRRSVPQILEPSNTLSQCLFRVSALLRKVQTRRKPPSSQTGLFSQSD